ncbi:GntR family transcriptional regulator [Paenibacillus sacheonensis]|uniref:Substrate-binding domain-containing protein n=1 Tax=Paenibacillus sacheonensis TaxID=742054 RepID=A0A7X4YQ99_9BACL|nr:substrate-binding domain-containing protein [Paenibacillus sacheonensis]MBM7565376.1 GntR family transcriptional regulator of arabinose operon [Paenibacillus sacheonensis]NBC69696.1 substrate-binding domain-containing protein [Paenibacillus sacheonensis]
MQEQRIPIYQVIQDYIKQEISRGGWKTGDQIPTEKELMAKFGVSRITVSNALTGLAKEGWLHRIQGKGSYVSGTALNEGTRGIQEGRQAEEEERLRLIGLITPSLSDYFMLRLQSGIAKALRPSNCHLVVMLSEGSKKREAEAIRELLRMGAEGLIIFPLDSKTHNDEILRLKLEKFPFLIIDRYLTGIETHFIGSDGVEAARLAVNHLHALGHRDIAICSGMPLSTTTIEQRVSGYLLAMKELGEKINPALMLTDFSLKVDGGHAVLDGEAGEDDPLRRCVEAGLATAYIALNGPVALHLYRIVKQLGLRVPQDLSIVAFDNLSPSREFDFFTYIDQHEEEVGRLAGKHILELMNESGEQPYRKIMLVPDIVARESTAPPSA